jgi:FkbM family methyltransferase
MRRLVYDVGMHRGEDTEFYLRRGFNVVGIEANPQLVEMLRKKFRQEISSGRVAIIDKAIGRHRGPARFFIHSASVWGTFSEAFADRNARRHGASVSEIEVECVPFADILREHGIPYYLKIDIEGSEFFCLDALGEFPQRPHYISIESCASSPGCGFLDTLRELQKLRVLGYRRFKYIDQAPIPGRKDHLSGESESIHYVFPEFSSGPFGKDLYQPWQSFITATMTGLALRSIDDLCGLSGRLYGRFGMSRLRNLRTRLTKRADHWYDLHASLE